MLLISMHKEENKVEHNEKITVKVDSDLEDLMPGYLQNRHGDIGKIQKALEQNDYESIRVLGHTMKGTGGGYGFDSITDIGRSIEQSAKDKNPEDIRKLIHELSSYLERVEVVYQ